MAMVAFPFGTSMPWDMQMENSQPAQPGLIAMRTIPLDGSQIPLSTTLPHLLGPPGMHPKEDTDEGSDEWYADQEDRHAEEVRERPRVRKSESRGLNLGKIPMAPGRVTNPGMAWFNKQTCEQLQEQLQEASDVSSAVEALVGHVWDLSRHPLGCRLVQLAMERCSQKQAAILASELRGHVQEAMTSPHANYVPCHMSASEICL